MTARPNCALARATIATVARSPTRRMAIAGLAVAASLGTPAVAAGEPLRPGAWDVTSTVTVLQVPGLPGFIRKLAQGRSKVEHKRLPAGQDVEALLAPDPKARCRIDAQHLSGGRYQQSLTCPQKRGDPVRIARTGTFDATGFTGEAIVDGSSAKGAVHIVLRQQARRTGD